MPAVALELLTVGRSGTYPSSDEQKKGSSMNPGKSMVSFSDCAHHGSRIADALRQKHHEIEPETV